MLSPDKSGSRVGGSPPTLILIVSRTNVLKWLAELFSDLEQAANNKPPIYKLIMFLDISHTPS